MDFTKKRLAKYSMKTMAADKGMIKVYDNFTNDYLYANQSLVFVENHDTNRFNEIYNNDIRKYKMAMALLATVRGIPQLYYGSEIGMNGNKDKGDADIRHDFPGWLLMRTTHSIQREDLKVKMSILILLLNYFNGEK
jgi:glycosidase